MVHHGRERSCTIRFACERKRKRSSDRHLSLILSPASSPSLAKYFRIWKTLCSFRIPVPTEALSVPGFWFHSSLVRYDRPLFTLTYLYGVSPRGSGQVYFHMGKTVSPFSASTFSCTDKGQSGPRVWLSSANSTLLSTLSSSSPTNTHPLARDSLSDVSEVGRCAFHFSSLFMHRHRIWS